MRMQNFQLLPLSAVRRSPCNNKTRQHCKTSTATMTKHSKKEHVIFPVLLWNTNILTTEFKNFNTLLWEDESIHGLYMHEFVSLVFTNSLCLFPYHLKNMLSGKSKVTGHAYPEYLISYKSS